MHFFLIVFTLSLTLLTSPIFATTQIDLSDRRLLFDIEYLAQIGVISTPINTRPLHWNIVKKDLDKAIGDPRFINSEALITRVLDKYKYAVGFQANLSVGLSSQTKSIPFETGENIAIEDQLASGLNNPNFSTHILHSEKVVSSKFGFYTDAISIQLQPSYERNVGERATLWLDDSYLSASLNKWIFTFGTSERWWGPSGDSALLLSNNARPVPALSISRYDSYFMGWDLFKWMGPTKFTTVFSQLEKNRYVPNAKFWGGRLSFKPLTDLEIGVSRASQWGGDGRDNSGTAFVNMFIGKDNKGERSISNINEPGNQLAGFDLSFRPKVNSVPVHIYTEIIGEDEATFLKIIPYPFKYLKRFGIDVYPDPELKVFFEKSSTLLTQLFSFNTYNHGPYVHHTYRSGYTYYTDIMGHSVGPLAEIVTFGVHKRVGQHLFILLSRTYYNSIDISEGRLLLLESDNINRISAERKTNEIEFFHQFDWDKISFSSRVVLQSFTDSANKKTSDSYVESTITMRL